jgi:hypothetical protein
VHIVVNHLHLRERLTDATVRAARDGVQRVVDAGALAAQVAKVDDLHLVLILSFAGADDAERVARAVGGPWMRENIVPLLVGEPDRSVGEVIASAQAKRPPARLRQYSGMSPDGRAGLALCPRCHPATWPGASQSGRWRGSKAVTAHDLAKLFDVRRAASGEHVGEIFEIARAHQTRADDGKEARVNVTVVTEPVDHAARYEERLTGVKVDLPPPTVNVVTPSSTKTVSSNSSWLCGAGMRALAGASHSKTLTLPPDSSAST